MLNDYAIFKFKVTIPFTFNDISFSILSEIRERKPLKFYVLPAKRAIYIYESINNILVTE